MSSIKLKINQLPGYSGIVTVKTDGRGVPLEQYWRRRLEDAKTDNCVEVVKPTKTVKPTKKERAKA